MSESEVEETPPGSPEATFARPSRQKSLSVKLKDAQLHLDELQSDPNKSVVVQCSQTGKQHTVKVKTLSKENGDPIASGDLTKGNTLLMDFKGKPYPAQFVKFAGKGPAKKGGKKVNGEDKVQLDAATLADALEKAKRDASKPPSAKKRKTDTVLDNEDKDLLINLVHKMEGVEQTLSKLVAAMEKQKSVKSENLTPTDEVVNGVHILRIPSRDAYSYALQLMDVFFTKEEMSGSLVFKSKKSSKPPLDQRRVEQILGYVERRYGEKSWDTKTLTLKMNQKCRDSKIPTEVRRNVEARGSNPEAHRSSSEADGSNVYESDHLNSDSSDD